MSGAGSAEKDGAAKKGEGPSAECQPVASMIVTVPEGATPGQLIQFRAEDGRMMQVPVPEGAEPGSEFKVQLSALGQQGQVVSLKVPETWKHGELVHFTAPNGTTMRVAVPEDKGAGDEFQVMLPPPPAQLKLTVPEGSQAGQEIIFMSPEGAKMRTKVPEGVNPGDSFTVMLRSPAPQGAATEVDQRLGHLCSAVSAGDVEAVQKLLDAGVNVNGVYDAGFTPIFYSATEGRPEVTKLLLEKKANAAAANFEQRTPLHWAARNGHLEVMRCLLAAKAPVDGKDKTGRTPLDLAQQKGHAEAVKLMQDVGA